jgi:hypothetical protein
MIQTATYRIPAELVDDIVARVEMEMVEDGFDVASPDVRLHIERMRARLDQSTMTFTYLEDPDAGGERG